MRALLRTALPGLALAFAALTAGCVDLTPCDRGSPGCGCRLPSEVSSMVPVCDVDPNFGTPGVCTPEGLCHVQSDSDEICFNACVWQNDGVCNDGGPGSSGDKRCALGSDCSDCGPRANECTDPARPVMCPMRFEATDRFTCWPAQTACHTVRACTDGGSPFGCPNGQYVNCDNVDQPGACEQANFNNLPNTCVNLSIDDNNAVPTLCRNGSSVTCNAALTDCREIEQCGSATRACFTGEQLTCNGNVGTCATTIQ